MLITIYVSKGKLEGALQLLDQGGRLELYLTCGVDHSVGAQRSVCCSSPSINLCLAQTK